MRYKFIAPVLKSETNKIKRINVDVSGGWKKKHLARSMHEIHKALRNESAIN